MTTSASTRDGADSAGGASYEGSCAALVEHLTDRAADLLAGGAPRVVVGVTGAPGSGKSTVAGQLEDALMERGLLAGSVGMDGFHMSNAVLDELGRHGRKGAPDTFDVQGYLAILDRIRARSPHGEPAEVLVPVYRREIHEPVAAGARIRGRGVVITEGNYLALAGGGWSQVRERIDLLVMLEVARAELITRLIGRHKAFGRSHADAAHWVRTVDLPNARLVASSAERCDEVWHLLTQTAKPAENTRETGRN